jgi:hypothetical protein
MRRALSSCIHAHPLSLCLLSPPALASSRPRSLHCPLAPLVLQTLHSLLGRARAMFCGLSIHRAHVSLSLSAVDTRLSEIGASAAFGAFGKQLLRLVLGI